MNGWTMPIQRASFRGVHFDVLSVEDAFDRAIAEHGYPFVNGADLEDMGLNPLVVKMQAVFYGEGYYADFKRFLAVLEKPGAAVLTHPIRGRLQDMICYSASFRHEADYVDYVAVDLSFKQATPMKPLFLFEYGILGKIDALISALESLVDDVLALWASVMEPIAFLHNIKSRVLGCYGALFGVFEQVRDLFSADKSRYSLSPSVTTQSFAKQSSQAVSDLVKMLHFGLRQRVNQPNLTLQARFDEVLNSVAKIEQIPMNLVTGKNASLSNSRQLKSLSSALSMRDIKEVSSMLTLICSLELAQIATEIIEQEQNELLPYEIDYICTASRTQFAKSVSQLRALAQQEENNNSAHSPTAKLSQTLSAPTTSIYPMVHQVTEKLRDCAHQMTELAIAAINQKPPLMIRSAPFAGNVVQMAHAFYQDYQRADEILRLNPQLIYPNFIQAGELLNTYAK